jgi:hypothetical protein
MAPNSTMDFTVAQGAASTSVDADSCSAKIVRDSWGSEIQRHSLISRSGIDFFGQSGETIENDAIVGSVAEE